MASGSKSARLALFGALLAAAVAWLPAQPAAPPVVGKIVVLVDGSPAAGDLAGLVSIEPGDVFSRVIVDRAVKAVFKTGLFADVSVESSGRERVTLTFALTRNLTVRRTYFTGFKVSTSRLKEAEETLRPGSIFREDLLPQAVDELKEALKGQGYFQAAIQAHTRRDPNYPRVDIYYRVTSWKRYRVASADIRGPVLVPPSDLERRMKTRAGRLYAPAVLERDIQNLRDFYAAIGYPRAEIGLAAEDFHEDAGTVDLAVEVQPREKIVVVINGAKVPVKLVAPIWQERIFEEWGLTEGEVRILNTLRKKGYVMATVKGRIERSADEMRVVYDVVPGRKLRINSVTFEGLQSFTAKAIKDALVVNERVLFFSSLSYDRLFALPREIEYFYQTHGFPDVTAGLDLKETPKGVDAVFRVFEGAHQTIQSIIFDGAHLFPAEDIARELVDKEGGPLFEPNVQRDVGIIESYYLNHGVRGTRVTSRLKPAAADTVHLVFDIEEGHPVTIRKILVAGNRVTRAGVIEKEIVVKEGAPADSSLIQETKRRLERLGIFSEVRTDEIAVGPDEENLIITVEEGERNYAGIGVGMETSDDASLALWDNPYSFRLSAEYIRSNMLGMASQLSLVGQYSKNRSTRAVVSWTQPYLFGLALQPSVLGWIERENRTDFDFDRRGGSFNLTRPLGRNLLLITTLSWSRTELLNVAIDESEIDRRLRNYATALGSVSLVWDRRDDPLNPTRGTFFSAVGQVASPVFGTESDYWKAYFKFQYFRPLIPRLDFGLTTRLGLCAGFVAIPERFFAGGSNSFRGERFDRLGPTDDAGNPIGGLALFLVNAEMQFPLFTPLRDLSGVAFFDLGNVFSEIRDFRIGGLESALGLGLRYRTPLGPVRLEMAWKLNAPDRRGRPLFFFTIGNVF